jgi:hypothetical protein
MKELDSHELIREIEICNLQDENKKLKEQLSGTTFCYDEEEHRRLKDKIVELERTIELSHANAKETLGEINYEQAAQQKEFMNYLQSEINYYKILSDKMGNCDYDNSKLKLSIYQSILLKYSEIVNKSERV